MTNELLCPMCGTHLELGHLLVDAENRSAFMRLMTVATPLAGYLERYVYLFSPPKTSLTLRKQARIILQLLPDLERRAITHRGRDWQVPLKLWEQAIDQMLSLRDAGKLDLPMTGHKYLYTILVSLADKVEGQLEAQAELAKRTPSSAATYQVRGQPMPMGQALAQVFGGVTPALAKMDSDRGTAAPMPDALRQKLANLKNPQPNPS
jgi:hypothetical protein